MNMFFKTVQSCRTLLNSVRAVFSRIWRQVLGGGVPRGLNSAKVEPTGPAFDQGVPVPGTETRQADTSLAPQADLVDPGVPAVSSRGTTTPESQKGDRPVHSVAFCGPVGRVGVSLGYVPPAKGIPSILRALGAA